VTGHGRLAFDDDRQRGRLAALFGSATCFVMPSFVEPFGITYVEAAAAGLPSIGTRVRGTTDSVGDGGGRRRSVRTGRPSTPPCVAWRIPRQPARSALSPRPDLLFHLAQDGGARRTGDRPRFASESGFADFL
jgi:hypothetical protein